MHEVHIISATTMFLERLRKRASAIAVVKYYLEENKLGGDVVEVTLDDEKQGLDVDGNVISIPANT